MVKTKLYAVEARRPGGAESKALTKDTWDETARLGDPDEWPSVRLDDLEVVAVREV